MIFQALAPSTEVFAQELDAVMEASVSAARAAGNKARSVQDAVATALQDADQAASDDAATTPGADAGATEGGDGSTNAGESQDSTTDGTTSGDAPAEGDASQGDAAADEGAADEEQADDADADSADQANVKYEYNTAGELGDAIGYANVTVDADKVVGVTIGTSEDLIKLSNTDPAIYQNAAITKGGATGSGLNLCNTVTAADGKVLSFLGLGAPNTPFKGSFGSGISPIVLNRPLFNNVELSADMTLKLTWKGATSDPIVASSIAGGDYKLVVALTVAPAVENTTAITLTSPLLGSVSGVLTLDATYAAKGSATPAVNIQSGNDNVGLLANTLVDAASLSVEQLTLPNDYNGIPTIQTTKVGACAGGLIGVCGNGATVSINGNVALSAFSVIGKAASGGLIGKATNLTLNIADGVTVKPACNVGDKDSACSGGVIGDVSFAQGFIVKPNMFDLGKLVTLGASQRAGALFGVADISNGDIVVQGGTYKSKFTLPEEVSFNGSYGGLVGKVFATAKGVDESLRAFVVQKDANEKTCSIEFELAGKLSDTGGVVGYVGDSADSNSQPVAVVLDDVTVACKGDASARTDAGKFGGAVGVVDARNVLDVRDFKLTSDNPIGKAQSNRAAGIAGSAWNAVIKFSGITDLSGASFAENSTTGQLVYENHNALIFAAGNGSNGELTDKGAKGWTFKRSNTASKTDDIATYGEVIRLGKGLDGKGLGNSFIALDPNSHKLTLPTSPTSDGGAYTLTSVEDFAKLAITWQTNGYYSMVEGVSENNPNILQSSTITVNGTIDLNGTGLTGFTQDRADGSQVFSGTLNGGGTNGNGTINLAVGEPYGKRGEAVLDGNDTSSGNGKIYRHGRLGLFAAVNGATISNVTIAGSMKFDNGSAIDAGSLAGAIVGNLLLSGVTCKTNIACDDTFGNEVNIGGIAGSVSAASTVAFEGNSKAQATITKAQTLNGNMRIGGAIGCVGDYTSTFNVARLEVGGSIETGNCASGKIAQVGGFIGCIAQGSNEKNVTITGLSFSEFAMTVGKNGDKFNGAGGLLGYSWGNAIVTIGDTAANTSGSTYALKTTNNTTVTANDSTEVGGLVYAASGHWIINNYAINLANASFTANSATTLGVLIARGSTSNSDNSFGAETNYNGLYLEDRAWWDTAYVVDDVSITAPKVKTYDEWLANGVKPESNLIDNGCNAVVSLHTKDEKLDMSGDPAKDNSYRNRIVPDNPLDKFPQTNGSVRYYYNLDKAYAEVGNNPENASKDNWMNSAEYLLLWCAYLYAPSAIQGYIIPGNQAIFQGNNIGTSDSAGVAINLDGYSFYPTDPASGSTVTVNNATITFHYSDIKAEQEGNKKNSEATQHEYMHCALIGTHTGSLKVKNVTLAGTVGSVVNDAGSSSGALVCCCIYGPVNETNVAQLEIDGLTLDGLKVDGVNGNTSYAPLLINEMQTCVNLSAKNISSTLSYAKGATAATSLFGRLGVGKNSDQVTAKFEQISLPSQENNTIFTHASLLESFGYGSTSTGSADYTFTKADADAGKVTYGSEIDGSTEYPGKQLWYYDETTYGTDSGLVTVDNKQASVTNPRFGDYLPYVYKGKATENGVQYHEIKVNQRLPKLLTGCGTYGDPYTVKDATEMNAIANYINNGTALDGWEVTIAANQTILCERRSDKTKTGNEVVYVYKQSNPSESKWEKRIGETTDPNQALKDETMRRYIQSAYYSIEPPEGNKITVDAASFGGFGNKANPFRGVIVGKPGASTATIEIENNNDELRGLVPYSYGSVVRNLNINYVNASATITYSAKDTDGVPTSFFGGVIGCILGGDNIIDGVVVNGTTADSPTTGFTVAGGGAKPHLVPIGGYVGAITGGGVIFRHMSGTSWRAGTKEKFKSRGEGGGNFQLYDNPYVGRVIDGYAFSEDCTDTVDNGDANYKINQLDVDDTGCVTTTDTYMKFSWGAGQQNNKAPKTTVKDPQGLLVLSAIINSGAGAGAAHTDSTDGRGTYRGSHAYEGSSVKGAISSTGYKFGNERYGKVRNANYTAVGKPDDAATAIDFPTSVNDDLKAPGNQEYQGPLDGKDGQDINSPYLVTKYATDWRTGYVCAMGVCGMDLQFERGKQGDPYDMTDYGSGFLGLSGRYYSNACATDKKVNDKDFITPGIATINGNGVTIKVKNNTREYVDDDYNIAGVGGLFSTIKFYSNQFNKGSIEESGNANVCNLNFESCNISLTYVTPNGEGQSTSTSNTNSGSVGVGCLAGSTANQGGSDEVAYGVFKNVDISSSTVAGGCTAGGLIGSAGVMSRSADGANGSIVTYGGGVSSPVQLYDCSYTGLNVTGKKDVGGYVGTVASACGVWTTAAEGVGEKTVGANSTITATGLASECRAGGVFGYTSSNVSVNTNIGTTVAAASSTAVISKVDVLITGETAGQTEDQLKNMGAGGVVGNAYSGVVSMSNVRIEAGGGAENATIGDKTGKNSKIRNAGGLIGKVTSGGSGSNAYWFEDCGVKNINIAGTYQCSGGLIGYYFSNLGIACNNIAIEGATIKGSWSGGLLGAINSGADVINVTNTKVSNTTFGGTSNGGIAGDGRGQFHLVNVLMDGNTYKSGVKQGVLLGEVDTRDNQYGLFAAGVDVKPGNGKTTSDLPPMVYTTNTAAVNKKTYIAFGDYNDTLAAPGEGTTLYGADGTATAAASPYVTTSPVSTLAVRASNGDTTDRYLFGDGVNVSGASTIKDQAGTNVSGRYTYTNIGGIADSGAYQNTSNYSSSSAGEFNANNDTDATKTDANPYVLVLSGNDSDTVKDYLNLVTNGGYSDALRLNADGSHVSATVDVFQLENGVFVKQTDVADRALDVKGSGSSLSISANSNWDNGKGRFNLLTVTFTEAGQSYKVMVPIIVKRVLEINFTATYSEGSNFNSADYSSKYDKHVLISSGETMTGYLTWTYNKAYTEPTEYGWNTHLASGGDMRPLNKRIEFGGERGALPVGTQLTLVDTAHNNKEYHYTVPEGGSCASVALTDFEDSSGNRYTEQWLSETMGTKATEADDGTWVKLSNEELTDGKNAKKTEAELIGIAGAKIDGDYYRLKTDADTKGPFYNLTVPKKGANEQPKSESFYLVVRTPENSANVNGYTGTLVTTTSVNTHINYVLRKDEVKDSLDSHENTASTYSVATNFQHNLVDKTSADGNTSISQMAVKGTTYPLDMNVSDTITFSEQEYTSSDALYYQLDSSLVNYGKNGSAAGAHGYPTGTQGTYSFYVTVGGKYYVPHASTVNGKTKWTWGEATAEDHRAATGVWTADGTDMKLTLADAGFGAIDLSGIREIAKNHGNEFTITMEANLAMTEPACQAGIIASQNDGTDKYTKPNYRAYLSTNDETLSTSSNSAYIDGKAGYYRMDVGSSTIALEASKKSQLGINIDDLKSADGEIALVGTYDLSKLTGAEAMISNASTVTYTLSLQRRGKDGYAPVGDISKYITVFGSDKLGAGSLSGSSYVFTDTKAGDTFATRDGNSLAFKHAFRVKVNTDVEAAGQTYANYRLVLTANMSDNGVIKDTPVNVSNLGGYKNSDYVTYTLARINTRGIPHGSN